MRRRDRWNIICDILYCLKENDLPKTRLMQKANLSWNSLNKYIRRLEQLKLIKLQKKHNRTVISLTTKGKEVQKIFRQLDLIMNKL